MKISEIKYEAGPIHGPCGNTAIRWRIGYDVEGGCFVVSGIGNAPNHAEAWAAASAAIAKILEGEK